MKLTLGIPKLTLQQHSISNLWLLDICNLPKHQFIETTKKDGFTLWKCTRCGGVMDLLQKTQYEHSVANKQ